MDMFCFQCEQTAGQKGCIKQGVCGKTPTCAILQDELLDELIKLANCCEITDENIELVTDGLFMTITNVNFDEEMVQNYIQKIKKQTNCDFDFNIRMLWNTNIDIRSLKSLILFGLKGIAAYYHHARVLGYRNSNVEEFFFEALKSIPKNLSKEELFNLVLKTGEINLKCMGLLDEANTKTYGNPSPKKVTTNIEKGPFIVVSGHDLKDLKLLLEQTKDKGINIYTHGEMLPCHGYPELNKYKHLKGNFGTAWQNQQKEFDNIPASILFTTNCIMPVKNSYRDRVFTTSVVGYPDVSHVENDFSPVIKRALKLGGYKENKKMTGINGGDTLTVGFGHNSIITIKDKLTELIKSGEIKHIFLVGGCDGAKTGRNYYTEFVKLTPKNSLVLTLACGKYRFNDINLGEIKGIPRLIDMGQCNDAYSAIKVALELAKTFNCNVNDLPLSMILSWYEQKAVCILLTLLFLGIKNIKLGPTLPAFISPNILAILNEKYKIKAITTPKEDLNEILNK